MMLAFGAIILFATKTDVKSIPQSVVFKSGMTACVAIFGIAWMADTFFKTAMPEFKAALLTLLKTTLGPLLLLLFWCVCR